MPKDVFDKIPKDRQLKLIKPAIKEFTRRSYDKINVTSLTNTMKILRTDFYYYFLDKDDLYDKLLDIFKDLINYNERMTFKEARINLFREITLISSSRTKTFIEDITETYEPMFTIELSERIIEMFDCSNVSYKELTIRCMILEFMTLINSFLKGDLKENEVFDILNK